MPRPKEVMIDGTRYVPVTEADLGYLKIARGLMEQFWGHEDLDRVSEEIESGELFVYVNDVGQGEPFSAVMAEIVNSCSRP